MKEQIKEIRVNIDGLYQLTKELKPMDCNNNNPGLKNTSQEIEDAAHSLIYAKAWLGKCLGELGAESPYKSGYKTVSDIEPTADTYKTKLTTIVEEDGNKVSFPKYSNFLLFNHIEKVDWLRTEIEKVINEVKQIGNAPNPPMLNREISIARTNAYNHLCEARFALGFEMARVKEENK